jgi:L-rhamnose mutarotase
MQRVAFLLKVNSNRLDEYKKIHQTVWPEMQQALSDAGWHNYSLFLREDGLLFGYFETPHDFDTARALMAEKEVNDRWQSMMAPFFESADQDQTHADDIMIELEEVFHLP